jgi:DNA polymerase-3 subunit delta'
MTAPLNFGSFIGNPHVVKILRRSVEEDRVPHALVFAGPEGVGKKTLALLLARRLNCLAPEAGDSCGGCRSCRKIIAGMHPDVVIVQPDGAFIKIDQVRAVIAEVAYQPFEGKYRVVILDAADQMRPEAANSLLKTLEEPPSRTILVLVTTQPYLLLPTIRSRAQIFHFTGIPHDRIAIHLVKVGGMPAGEASLAAALSKGSLAAALGFDIGEYRNARAQAIRLVSLLLGKGSFTEMSRLAASLPKDRAQFLAWLDVVDSLLQDIYYSQVARWRMCQPDIVGEIEGLARLVPHSAVISTIKAVTNLRRSTLYNVNRQIALESLFLAQAAGRTGTPE